MLTMKGIHHPKGNLHCIYLHKSKDGIGLICVEDTHTYECTTLAKYLLNSTDTLTKMVHETTTLMQKFLFKSTSSPNFTTPKLTDDSHH
eukprot:15285215-Ditylum_brightwellii.AAC.1